MRITRSTGLRAGQSLVTMAEFIGEALGIKPNMTIEPARVGEVTHYVANIGKARALLNYDPKTPLKEGLKSRWRGQPSGGRRTKSDQ